MLLSDLHTSLGYVFSYTLVYLLLNVEKFGENRDRWLAWNEIVHRYCKSSCKFWLYLFYFAVKALGNYY